MSGTSVPKIKILIVEDDEDIRSLMQELLELEGHPAEGACNGQEGLDRLRGYSDEELPGLILLDLTMPVKDGFAFRSEQERDARLAGIPIVVMSADAHIEEKTKTMGARDLLRKPLDIDRLIAVIEREMRRA